MRALQAILSSTARDKDVAVVLGAEHPDMSNIKAVCAEHGFDVHVQTNRIAELMAAADLAIGAGGISSFERLYLRLPSIIRPISSNQIEQVEHMAELGLVTTFADYDQLATLLNDVLNKPTELPADEVGGKFAEVKEFLSSGAV